LLLRREYQESYGVRTMVECPVCDAQLELSSDAVEGELMECADCGTELEVTSVNPPKVAEAPETEEDWGE
jgi:alpha-aminoadipate carrier protein LysW